MGTLKYANVDAAIEIDDEILVHLRAVTVTKLRRNESFALTIPLSDDLSETIWIHPSIPIQFVITEDLALHRPLLADMMDAANSALGLDLTKPRFTAPLDRSRTMHAMSA